MDGAGRERPIVGIAIAVLVLASSCTDNQADDSALPDPEGPTLAVEYSIDGEPVAADGSGLANEYSIVATAIDPEIVARAGPSFKARELARFDHPRETGGPLVFQVIGHADEPWLEVLLPMRPNGTVGWIPAADVDLSRNPYRIAIDTSSHQLTVFEAGRPIVTTTVAIGTGATPTPIGSFYLTELLRPPDQTGPYGTHAYGLSGYSETLLSFNGGDGVIGLHGTNDPDSLGTDVSHGCVRLANETIDELVAFLPLGTPVLISV